MGPKILTDRGLVSIQRNGGGTSDGGNGNSRLAFDLRESNAKTFFCTECDANDVPQTEAGAMHAFHVAGRII